MKLRLLPLSVVLVSTAAASCTNVQQAGSLDVNRTVLGSLTATSTAEYSVQLDSGFFVYGEVDQRSVDVIVTIYGPNGDRVEAFDASDRRSETFRFESEVAGIHLIEVSSFGGESGEYAIELKRAEPVAESRAERLDQIGAPYDGDDRPGLVVALVEQGSLTLVRSYGMANLEWGVPNGTDIKYNIGSTSKQFTAFAVSLLATRGQLSLDSDVREYLPELPQFDEVVTLRHLLTHTSGYRDMMDLVLMGGREPEDQFDQGEAIPHVQRQTVLQESPGSVYRYNNTGYMLLALVVERVTGQPFATWVTQNIFAPAGMHDSAYRWSRGIVIERAAEGYIPGPGGFRRGIQNSATYGPSNLYATVPDLAKWMANLSSGAVGGKELIGTMTTPNTLTSGDPTVYGLGLRIDEDRGLRRIQHSGGAMAFRSWFAYYPKLDAGLIIVSNSSAFERSVVTATVDAFFGAHMDPVPESSSQTPGGQAVSAPWTPTVDALREYEGSYFSRELETFYEVVVVDGSLTVEHRRLGILPLRPAATDRFETAYPFTELEFGRDDGGSIAGLSISSERNNRVGFVRIGTAAGARPNR